MGQNEVQWSQLQTNKHTGESNKKRVKHFLKTSATLGRQAVSRGF